ICLECAPNQHRRDRIVLRARDEKQWSAGRVRHIDLCRRIGIKGGSGNLEQRTPWSGHRVLCVELLSFLFRNGVCETEAELFLSQGYSALEIEWISQNWE